MISDSISYAPFSFGGTVVMSEADFRESAEVILLHENSHIRMHHWIDLLVSQMFCIFQWYNPAAWLTRRELRAVHEYQADACVIAAGTNIRQYQILLIKKAVGARFPSLANSLNHSNLKKRITMMYNQNKSRAGLLRLLTLAPALGIALAVAQIPAVASVISNASHAELQAPAGGHKVANNPAEMQAGSSAAAPADDRIDPAPDQLPEFPGGMEALYNFLIVNIKMPEQGADGRVVVSFVIDKEGKVTHPEIIRSVSPEADAEAIRVVKLLPAFKPGTKDGKPVDAQFALPIQFKTISTPAVPAQPGK